MASRLPLWRRCAAVATSWSWASRIAKPPRSPVKEEMDIVYFFWATNDRLIYGIDAEGNEAFGLYAVNKDGSDWRELIEPVYGVQLFPTSTFLLDRLKGG